MGNDPRYTPTTTFETFPFPWPPGKEPETDPRVLAIAAAAKMLDAERAAWLNPPELAGSLLTKRTLTNLYNALEKFRASQKAGKAWLVNESEPGTKFAARLAELHTALEFGGIGRLWLVRSGRSTALRCGRRGTFAASAGAQSGAGVAR